MTAYCGPLIPLSDAGGPDYTKSLWVSSNGYDLCAKGINVQPFPSGTTAFGIYTVSPSGTAHKQIAGLCAAHSTLGVWIRYDDATADFLTFTNNVTTFS